MSDDGLDEILSCRCAGDPHGGHWANCWTHARPAVRAYVKRRLGNAIAMLDDVTLEPYDDTRFLLRDLRAALDPEPDAGSEGSA